jgi:hypothetical protein
LESVESGLGQERQERERIQQQVQGVDREIADLQSERQQRQREEFERAQMRLESERELSSWDPPEPGGRDMSH